MCGTLRLSQPKRPVEGLNLLLETLNIDPGHWKSVCSHGAFLYDQVIVTPIVVWNFIRLWVTECDTVCNDLDKVIIGLLLCQTKQKF